MASVIGRKISGKVYYYLEENVKIGEKRWKKVSIYLGKSKPAKEKLRGKKKELGKKAENAIADYYSKRLSEFEYCLLSRKELAEVERSKDNFQERLQKLSKNRRKEVEKKQVVDFVYTTLRTEGVDVNFSDVETAFTIIRKKQKEYTFDPKVMVSSSMITGFDYLPKIGINQKDVLRLHGIIMSLFEEKNPGQLRDDQRIIARFNPKTLRSEEIKYRPPGPKKVREEFEKFFDWFGKNKALHPLELAALTHLKLYLMHPFKDGNKRMCRLLFNKVLIDAGYPAINPSKDTKEYFEALIKSVETGKEKFFVKFCYQAFVKQVKYRRLK